jgi:type IV secretory pathway VirB2 component (pilin)
MRSRASVLALGAGVALALAAQPFTAGPAHAGGAIGWANAVTQFSTEGEAVGAAAVILGIIAIGAVLFFGLSGLVGTVIMACLGGALMAKAPSSWLVMGCARAGEPATGPG